MIFSPELLGASGLPEGVGPWLLVAHEAEPFAATLPINAYGLMLPLPALESRAYISPMSAAACPVDADMLDVSLMTGYPAARRAGRIAD